MNDGDLRENEAHPLARRLGEDVDATVALCAPLAILGIDTGG